MKVKNLCAASLAAVLGVAFVGATSAEASPTELQSKGKVTVTEGVTDGKDGNKEDPEIPTEPIVDPGGEEITGNEDAGNLVIQVVSNMDFGSIARSTSAVTKAAKPVELEGAVLDADGNVVLDANGKATGDGIVRSRGQYVQWADLRKDTTSGYTLSAKMTQQFKESGGTELTGASIEYSNGIINSASVGTWGTIDKTMFKLDGSGNSETVASATGNGVGKGVYFVEYGQSTDYVDAANQQNTVDTTGNSVFLNVPAATASSVPTDVQYNAVVTWTLTAA